MQSATPQQPCPKIVPGQQKLMQEQEQYILHASEAQGKAMLSCEPVDEAQAEAHLHDAYRVARLEPPLVRWFDSPASFALAYASVKQVDRGKIVPRKVWDDVWRKVVTDVVEERNSCLAHQKLEKSVISDMSFFIYDERYTSMMESIEEFLERGIWLFLNERETVEDNYYHWARYKMTYGTALLDSILCAATYAYYFYDNSVWHMIEGNLFEPCSAIHIALFNGMVSGYMLGPEEAWLIRKPVRLEFDEQDRLHSASGMWIQYRDGWGIYGWHACSRTDHYEARGRPDPR